MSELLVYDHNPSINASGVYINPTIRIYFDKELDVNTITSRTISLNSSDYIPIEGEIGYDWTNSGTPSGIANIITFKPNVYLDANTKYNVFIHKQPSSVYSVDGSTILDTYKFSFTTGTTLVEDDDISYLDQLYIDLQKAIDEENWLEAARIQQLIDDYLATGGSGIVPDPVTPEPTTPDDMLVVSQIPEASSSNNKLKFIKVTFNDELLSTGTYVSGVYTGGVDMSDMLSLTYKHVLE